MKNLKARIATFLAGCRREPGNGQRHRHLHRRVSVMWVPVHRLRQHQEARGRRPAPGELTPRTSTDGPRRQVSDKEVWVGQAGRKLAQYENAGMSNGASTASARKRGGPAEALRRTRASVKPLRPSLRHRADARVRALSRPQGVPLAPAPLPNAQPFPPSSALRRNRARTARQRAIGASFNAPFPGADPSVHLARRPRPSWFASASARGPGSKHRADTVPRHPHRTSTTSCPSRSRAAFCWRARCATGGQAQSNPHPVFIRLVDDSSANRFRCLPRCFVIAAGYGDISAERAYLRTETLSCVGPTARD